MRCSSFRCYDGAGHRLTFIDRGVTFFTSKYFLVTPDGVKAVAFPEKTDVDAMVDGHVILELNQDWDVNGTHFTQGSLVSLDADAIAGDPANLKPTLVYAPGPRESIGSVAATKSHLLVVIYQNVRGHAFVFTPDASGRGARSSSSFPTTRRSTSARRRSAQ